ncbi:MAG: NrfD/PsrC family molybdoenzyme membrane anchor subunit [Quisquiliibacterium sp.]
MREPGHSLHKADDSRFWALAAAGVLLVAIGLVSAHYMETAGHIVTGMNNHVVWGVPHVFAIFLIVSASGVLNVASIGSVFGKTPYKARAPLSGLLSLAMLAGGLMVLMLDLGRPERVIVAATHYNFRSVFAWNVFLYTGMFAIVAVYLWTMLEKRINPWSRTVGVVVFAWRLVLTTGTGAIFAFLVAREGYGSALLPILFIVLSFAWGMAVFLITQAALYRWNSRHLPEAVHRRMSRLLGVFVIACAYLVTVLHLTNLYFARNLAYERFVLIDGGVYSWLFWLGFVLAGTVLPLLLIFPRTSGRPSHVLLASMLVVVGGFCLLYVFIVGGQAWPLELFPGASVSSSFYDGKIAPYYPSLPEFLLGVGGVATAFLITIVGVRVFEFMPQDSTRDIDADQIA